MDSSLSGSAQHRNGHASLCPVKSHSTIVDIMHFAIGI